MEGNEERLEDPYELQYFNASEFVCPCCGKGFYSMNVDVLHGLDKAREHAGIPFVINSGWRCERHNPEVGGNPTSSHLRGLAVDIRARSSRERSHILRGLYLAGFHRIGVSPTFIHVDGDSEKPANVHWLKC